MPHDLIEKAQLGGTPLIEGQQVTFVWRGQTAPHLVGDLNDWDEEQPLVFTRAARQLWKVMVELPPDAYLEYIFVQAGKRLVDPYNPNTVSNDMGGTNNFFVMPEYRPTPLARRPHIGQRGQMRHYLIETDGLAASVKRSLTLYRPQGEAPCPLLVVFDGSDYLRKASLAAVVDNLIAQGRIRPVALALVENGRRARMVEYGACETTLLFLTERVLPFARQQLNLLEPSASPGRWGVMGASMGGLMALYAGLRLPDLFGRVLSQSGAFAISGRDTVVFDLLHTNPNLHLKAWLDVGRYEDLLEPNQRMFRLLTGQGYQAAFRIYNAGHNYTAWRDDLGQGLEYLFGAKEEKRE